MTRILLYSEGYKDQGRSEYTDGKFIQHDGVFQIFIKKLAGDVECSFIVKTHGDIKNYRLVPSKGRYKSKESIQAQRLVSIANQLGCHHIAYHQDADKNEFKEIYEKVHSYFSVDLLKGIRLLAIVPKPMTESWLLADKGSFRKAFPRYRTDIVLPDKPEEIWGNKNTDSHPKKWIADVLYEFHQKATAGVFARLASYADIAVIKERCPVSFKRFCDDVEMFLFKSEGD